MKNVLTIVKKEFARFFKDKRMVLTVFLPGLLIFALYSILGAVMSEKNEVPDGFKPYAYFIDMPEKYSAPLAGLVTLCEDALTEEQAMDKAEAGELVVAKYVHGNGGAADEIRIFYNSSSKDADLGYRILSGHFARLQNPDFVINKSEDVTFDFAKDSGAASVLAMLIPMLMFSLLASSCMAVAPESIAGEKERGTMATMLITPIRRWQLALGKIISLTCFAMLSGISSFLGVIFSLPKLVGGLAVAGALTYTVGDYFMIFALIISIVFVIIAAFSVVSCFAKSVKESASLIGPLMIVIILLGLASSMVPFTSIGYYLIPLMGSGMAVSSIMGLSVNGLGVALAVLSNLVAAAGLTVLLAFMFRSERIMFKR